LKRLDIKQTISVET